MLDASIVPPRPVDVCVSAVVVSEAAKGRSAKASPPGTGEALHALHNGAKIAGRAEIQHPSCGCLRKGSGGRGTIIRKSDYPASLNS